MGAHSRWRKVRKVSVLVGFGHNLATQQTIKHLPQKNKYLLCSSICTLSRLFWSRHSFARPFSFGSQELRGSHRRSVGDQSSNSWTYEKIKMWSSHVYGRANPISRALAKPLPCLVLPANIPVAKVSHVTKPESKRKEKWFRLYGYWRGVSITEKDSTLPQQE